MSEGKKSEAQPAGVHPLVVVAIAIVVLGAGVAAYLLMGDAADSRIPLDGSNEAGDAGPAVEQPYDIDLTVRVMWEIDQALAQSEDLGSYLRSAGQLDYTRVAPAVRDAHRRLLDQLQEVAQLETEAEGQAKMWNWTRSLLSAARMVKLDLGTKVGPDGLPLLSGSIGLDNREAASVQQEYFGYLMAKQKSVVELTQARSRLDSLLRAYFETSYRFVAEWDRVCSLRDQAYIAAKDRYWEMAIQRADEAIALAPFEREAHLIKAQALIEAGGKARFAQADEILQRFVEDHPGHTAPALLLLGVLARWRGSPEDARHYLQTASAQYPKQAASLTSMLDPYAIRARHLRKTKVGLHILEYYKATMHGAGYYSPDLQLARLHFSEGDFGKGREKVIEHFSRRRLQESWDFILSDVRYCYDYFGSDFRQILPEQAYLDLRLDSDLDAEVVNRSDVDLHNATLVVCWHYTDMHPDDYHPVAAATIPVLRAGEKTSFDLPEPEYDLFGKQKGAEDIDRERSRAILISEDAITWVDSEYFKRDSLRKAREQRERGAPPPELETEWFKARQTSPAEVRREVFEHVIIEPVPRTLRDDHLRVRLPKKLAILQPFFRLVMDGEPPIAPSKNVIQGDEILLQFDADREFGKHGANLPAELRLELVSPFIDLDTRFRLDLDSGEYKLEQKPAGADAGIGN